MQPSPALESLLSFGEVNGWDYSARTMALGLIQSEASANTAWAAKKSQTFLKEEELLPAENIKSLRAVLALDSGASGDGPASVIGNTITTHKKPRAVTSTPAPAVAAPVASVGIAANAADDELARAERKVDELVAAGRLRVIYHGRNPDTVASPSIAPPTRVHSVPTPKASTARTAPITAPSELVKTEAHYAAEYKANRNLRAEFISERSYVLFAMANAGGSVRIHTRPGGHRFTSADFR